MEEWLDRLIPPGSWHAGLVEGTRIALACALGVLTFVVLRWMVVRTLVAVTSRLQERLGREDATGTARLRTLEGLARSLTTYILLFLVVVTVLGQLGVNVSALLAGAGVVGLALSFGAQRLVRDLFSGVFLLLEDQFRVGEVVTLVGGAGLPQFTGEVLEMGLRTTRLRDLAGKMLTLSNGDISAVVNHSRGPLRATVEVGVPPEVPLDELRSTVSGIALPDSLFSGPAEVEGVSALEGSRTVLRIGAPSVPGQAPKAELILRQVLGEALRQAGIELR